MGTIVREPMRGGVQRPVTSTFDKGRYHTQAIAKGPQGLSSVSLSHH